MVDSLQRCAIVTNGVQEVGSRYNTEHNENNWLFNLVQTKRRPLDDGQSQARLGVSLERRNSSTHRDDMTINFDFEHLKFHARFGLVLAPEFSTRDDGHDRWPGTLWDRNRFLTLRYLRLFSSRVRAPVGFVCFHARGSKYDLSRCKEERRKCEKRCG